MTAQPMIETSDDMFFSPVAQRLLEHVPVGILVREGSHVLWANETLLEQVDSDQEELLAASLGGGTSGERFSSVFGSEERIWVKRRNDEVRCLRRIVGDLDDPSRTVCYFLDIGREMDLEKDVRRLAERVESLETQDRETGLLNRHAVLAALDRQVTRSRRYGNPLSVVWLSLEPPHHAADASEILRGLSQEFRAQLRWADEVGRLDRTSFLLILPETSEDSAQMLVDKLRHDQSVLARCAEGWAVSSAAVAWRKGDDRRRLLSRAGVDV